MSEKGLDSPIFLFAHIYKNNFFLIFLIFVYFIYLIFLKFFTYILTLKHFLKSVLLESAEMCNLEKVKWFTNFAFTPLFYSCFYFYITSTIIINTNSLSLLHFNCTNYKRSKSNSLTHESVTTK